MEMPAVLVSNRTIASGTFGPTGTLDPTGTPDPSNTPDPTDTPDPSNTPDPAGGSRQPMAAAASADYFLPYQHVPIPLHSMGPDGMLLAVNEAWRAFTGYSELDAVGHSFATFLEPSSAELYRRRAAPEMIASVPSRESRSVEYRLIKASGEVADILVTARPERDPATGRFLHSIAVITDVTARNRAEHALRQTQKLEALGNLTGGVAHDFNNLLSVILGSLELLTPRLPKQDVRAARLVEAATLGAKRGAALTARLLAFARQQELQPVPLDPHLVLAALRPLLIQLLGPDIVLQEDVPDDGWSLCADPNQLELALLNLAANARDAMPDGGRLKLSIRNASVDVTPASSFIDPRVRHAVPAGEYVVVAVQDTGFGMDEAALARAADPFFTTKGPGKGTGLGLSMVHGFAVQSGGAMLLSSQPGAGTTAELWLPRTIEPVVPAEVPARRADLSTTGGSERLRILLVDDDPLVVAGAAAMLEELGHEVGRIAASGSEALAILRHDDRFDLLMTDYVMPGMTGGQLAAQARVMYPKLPILLASGFADLDKPIGPEWPRLRKPFNLQELSNALAALRSA
jgi:PAS domain S-box-containing protein